MKINSAKRGGNPPLRTDSVNRFLTPSLIQRLQQPFMFDKVVFLVLESESDYFGHLISQKGTFGENGSKRCNSYVSSCYFRK